MASLSQENNNNDNTYDLLSVYYIQGTDLYVHCPIFVLE